MHLLECQPSPVVTPIAQLTSFIDAGSNLPWTRFPCFDAKGQFKMHRAAAFLVASRQAKGRHAPLAAW
jgi:hypothetical protein